MVLSSLFLLCCVAQTTTVLQASSKDSSPKELISKKILKILEGDFDEGAAEETWQESQVLLNVSKHT
jgi:hypothetical protein